VLGGVHTEEKVYYLPEKEREEVSKNTLIPSPILPTRLWAGRLKGIALIGGGKGQENPVP